MKYIILIIFVFSYFLSNAQQDSTATTTEYSFILMDSPAQLFTMRQVNQSYLSGYRLFARNLDAVSKNETMSTVIQVVMQSLLLMPLTHEEGHRSILTVNNIGSISQPYFNKSGAAYVKGVTDQTLIDLRDNDLPNYIRLHTGGLESDFMLCKRMESIGSFEMDDFKNYKWEYWFRKIAIMQYYLTGLVGFEIDLKEETNELERDIVGYDTYGVARHLFRPTMAFHRYTRFDELSGAERSFVQRLGYRSLLNLLNPLMMGKGNFELNDNTKINVGMGYTMAPFGDFIDENIWLKYKELNIAFYARQFQNKENWFHGLGLSLNDFHLYKKLYSNVSLHYWNQPNNFDFNAKQSFHGGAIDVDIKYRNLILRNTSLKGFSLDLGIIYKTKGFLPEELYLNEHLGVRIGSSIRI